MLANQGSSRIFGLDLMRAIAITMVLAGHCLWIYPQDDSFFLPSFTVIWFFWCRNFLCAKRFSHW
jgi:peptidoglycan/LPS O-acetylase OafA/YrhL